MTNPASSTSQPPQPPNESNDPYVVNPIHIARARHASAHSQSAVDKAGQVSIPLKDQPTSTTPDSVMPFIGDFQWRGFNGCVLLFLLGLTFLVGGFFGGM